MLEQILKILFEEGSIELTTEDHHLHIGWRVFFSTKEEFLFTYNAKPIYGCKSEAAARRKISAYLEEGFKLEKELWK